MEFYRACRYNIVLVNIVIGSQLLFINIGRNFSILYSHLRLIVNRQNSFSGSELLCDRVSERRERKNSALFRIIIIALKQCIL